MQRNVGAGIVGAVLILLGTRISAYAGPIVFNFNHASLSDGATNAVVQTYMQGVLADMSLPSGVTVTGTKVEKDYTGDNFVVGPVSGNAVKSLTLGNSDQNIQHPAPLDGYIYNHDSVMFAMTFPFPIYGVSFDYEIFPNSNCANPPSSCSVAPDFTFKAGNLPGPLTTYLYKVGADPQLVAINGYQHSPMSGPIANEQAAQWLGMSGYIALPGVTKLEFYDWPERVAIDNLAITTAVPEPATMLLLGTGLTGLCVRRRKKQKASSDRPPV